jgi:hypothetical protein
MEETASRCRKSLGIYLIGGYGKATRGGPAASAVGWEIITFTVKTLNLLGNVLQSLGPQRIFGTIYATENGHEIWHLEC